MIDSRTKILIVDDELSSRRIMEKIIRNQWKCNLFLADDGAEALKIMLKELPNLVILDMVMPFMSGIQVLQTMRKTTKLAKINVLICTAVDDNRIVKEVLKYGVLDYLVKPVNKETLVGKLTNLLRN
ncbi:response regulator [candidate division KSB1 bacterium]|nr:response regulator [candidate division KSB1 bacterium]